MANRAVVGGSKCIIYAASADADRIAKAIMKAFDNRKMLAKWGANGRAIMREKYDWATVVYDLNQYLDFLRISK
jgi:glycosyltransferase involved in cell wall biosynthesis